MWRNTFDLILKLSFYKELWAAWEDLNTGHYIDKSNKMWKFFVFIQI